MYKNKDFLKACRRLGVDVREDRRAAKRIGELLRDFQNDCESVFDTCLSSNNNTTKQISYSRPSTISNSNRVPPYLCPKCRNMVIYKPCLYCRILESISEMKRSSSSVDCAEETKQHRTISNQSVSPTPTEIEQRAREIREVGFVSENTGRWHPPWNDEMYNIRSSEIAVDD